MADKYVKGLDATLKNLRARLDAVPNLAMTGLRAGGLVVQRDAQQHVPVEHGPLRQSAFTRPARNDKMVKVVEVGFTAAYAPFVHENLQMILKGKPRPSGKGVYWGPAGEARFLANAVERQKDEIVRLVVAYSEIKK